MSRKNKRLLASRPSLSAPYAAILQNRAAQGIGVLPPLLLDRESAVKVGAASMYENINLNRAARRALAAKRTRGEKPR